MPRLESQTIERIDHDPYKNGAEADLADIIVLRRTAPDGASDPG